MNVSLAEFAAGGSESYQIICCGLPLPSKHSYLGSGHHAGVVIAIYLVPLGCCRYDCAFRKGLLVTAGLALQRRSHAGYVERLRCSAPCILPLPAAEHSFRGLGGIDQPDPFAAMLQWTL